MAEDEMTQAENEISDAENVNEEAAAPVDETAHEIAHAHIPSDTTDVLGITLPFPIYTAVFVILAVLTVIEVVVGTGGSGAVIAIILAAIAFGKAYLVVSYYMHLRTDNRLFTYTLVFPLIVGILGILWLILVAPEAGGVE